MRTIAIINQKGGCGKTTTAVNLAAVYARRGARTLIVDLDPQSHCAAGLGVPEDRIDLSIGDALTAAPATDGSLKFDPDRLLWPVARNLALAPSTMRLAMLEAPGGGLHEMPDRDQRLARVLSQLRDRFDCCLVDCPPTVGILTFNALAAVREVLVPIETGYFAMRGAEKQWNTIQRVIARSSRPIACHMLPTLFDESSDLARDILREMRRRFAGQIIPVAIGEHEALREAASMGQAVIEYAPDSQARADYESLADWLDDHVSDPVPEIEVTAAVSDAGRGVVSQATDGPPAEPPAPTGDRARDRAAEMVGRLRTPQPLADEIADATPPDHRDARPADPVPSMVDRSTADTTDTDAALGGVAIAVTAPAARATAAVVEVKPEPANEAHTRVRHLFGTNIVSGGVLFVQPLTSGTMAIAGDFNRWSPTSTPMRRNEALGVAEALVRLEPGQYAYRLVVDGRWQADPYNDRRVMNGHGEPNSIIEIPDRRGGAVT